MTLLETERLILREWKESDLEPFYRLNSDPEVMAFFPARLTKSESDVLATEIQRRISDNGWGFWAVELKSEQQFIGLTGLNVPTIDLPFNPCIEVGWRLARKYWGYGYAQEGARKAMEFAFDVLSCEELVSFTSLLNKRSELVMQRLGMVNTGNNFFHPGVPSDSPLSEHVLYRMTSGQ